jgi:sentrin-specific protease 1
MVTSFSTASERPNDSDCSRSPTPEATSTPLSSSPPCFKQAHHNDPRERNVYDYDRVRSWANRTPCRNIFLLKRLLIPVNIHNTHWACVCINFPGHTITYLDSDYTPARATTYTEATLRYLQDEHLQRVRQPLPTHRWSSPHIDTPQQDNVNDCGVFCCTYMDYILQDKPWDFDARHTPYLRYCMALTLIQQHLMD